MALRQSDIKSRLIAWCDELAEVVNEKAIEYGDDVLKNLEELKEAIRSHVFKVYLVGEFSCGKSSLLNRWLGRDLLLTGLTPKTAVSSELHFAENEHMVLQSLKPEIQDMDLRGITETNMAIVQERANAGELANVVLYVDNPRLQECGDMCLVDLPGLSSANAAHELALNRFLQERQCVAVFCIPIADGSIQDTSLSFLRKMDSFRQLRRFEFLLTKADERTERDQEKIRAKVREDLSAHLGIDDIFVGKVSRESTEDFSHLVEAFHQKQDTFLLKWFGDKLRTIAEGIIDSLQVALSVRYDSSRIDDALARIEETERDELPALVAEINEDMRCAVQTQVSNVLASVRETVQGQKAALMAHAQSGGNCMDEVASLIRSTLASKAPAAVQTVMNDAGRKAGDVLDERLDFNFEADVAPSQGVEVVPAESPVMLFSGEDPIAPIRRNKSLFAKNFCLGWQIAEVGSVLANIIAPGAGFLSTMVIGGIGTLLMDGFNSEEERGKQEADFEMALSQACENARPAITASIERAIDQCGRKLQSAVEDKVKSLHAQIGRLKAESAAEKADWEARQLTRQKAKARVMDILAKLED